MAAEVCEAVFLDKVCLQGADGFDVAVGEGVCVPGLGPAVFVAVQEDDCCGEVVVVFDDVLEVGEAFAAFVDGGVARGEGVVDCVDYVSPSTHHQHWILYGVGGVGSLTRSNHCSPTTYPPTTSSP